MSQYFWGAPPIARTLTAITFPLSLLVYTGVLPYPYFFFSVASLQQLPPELWRLFTPFFLTEPSIGVLFDSYFLFTYGAKLEIASPRFSQRADFFTYICFVCLVILLSNAFITDGTRFASVLALSFITTSTIDSWGLPTSFFGLFTFPAQYLPYLFLLITLICRGTLSFLIQLTGLFAAHFYDFLTGLHPKLGGPDYSLIRTPEFLKKMFGTRNEVQKVYGTGFASASTVSSGSGSAWSVGWGRRGPGQRLGGDAESGALRRSGPGRGIIVALVLGFVLVACGLGLVFMMRRDPEGWWTTLKEAVLGGDMSVMQSGEPLIKLGQGRGEAT